MVKPTDSSGSKGVAKLSDPAQLPDLVANALQYSREKRFIIEEYVEMDGYQLTGDAFSIDGRLAFHCFFDQHLSPDSTNPFVPTSGSTPTRRSTREMGTLIKEVNRLFGLLKMGSQAYNIDVRFDACGRPWLMEVGPRNGGNMIAQVIEKATGVDLVAWMIRTALGEDCSALKQVEPTGHWACYVVHADKSGTSSSA